MYKEIFSDQEWKQLEVSIVWMFQAIARIDKNIDENELDAFLTLPSKIEKIESELLKELIKNFQFDKDTIIYYQIADIEEIRTVFILKTKSSERLRSQISNLVLALNLKLSKDLEAWDGALDDFEILVPQIINEYFELYYKESFRLSKDVNLIAMKKEKRLSKMEMRIINVIQSTSQDNLITDINNIVELVHEENKDVIIEAIESLIKQKIIIPVAN